jgi:predicted N-acyltransferase
LSQKRRRNYRKENQAFIAAGAKIECVEGPLSRDSKILRSLIKFLRASEARATVYAPFNNVMINPSAFATQKQTLLVASICNKPVGFIAFVHAGEVFMQVHGGLDYQQSELIFAYHNLIYAGIREAISRGLRLVTMGPLNNETKRRASTELVPMVVSVKNHSLIDRLLARNWFYPRMGAYFAPCRKGA